MRIGFLGTEKQNSIYFPLHEQFKENIFSANNLKLLKSIGTIIGLPTNIDLEKVPYYFSLVNNSLGAVQGLRSVSNFQESIYKLFAMKRWDRFNLRDISNLIGIIAFARPYCQAFAFAPSAINYCFSYLTQNQILIIPNLSIASNYAFYYAAKTLVVGHGIREYIGSFLGISDFNESLRNVWSAHFGIQRELNVVEKTKLYCDYSRLLILSYISLSSVVYPAFKGIAESSSFNLVQLIASVTTNIGKEFSNDILKTGNLNVWFALYAIINQIKNGVDTNTVLGKDIYTSDLLSWSLTSGLAVTTFAGFGFWWKAAAYLDQYSLLINAGTIGLDLFTNLITINQEDKDVIKGSALIAVVVGGIAAWAIPFPPLRLAAGLGASAVALYATGNFSSLKAVVKYSLKYASIIGVSYLGFEIYKQVLLMGSDFCSNYLNTNYLMTFTVGFGLIYGFDRIYNLPFNINNGLNKV
ncbi:hypothetical protein RFI_20436 [Reticulomyxa filosa]|uniref:Uncharacterized protein n=1 Tax=Reticulomyxa filosa TaxID=46433 RepID=X6MU09_RETFI|nr:hypothetical protein RFI_20436 [Reticulomyxa filosa]|eukprot:ETO16902.1 hypothetical protein RFI_20436 [Reticulomyxa filosa]